MRRFRKSWAALLLVAAALLPSCTELDGQRITLRYDAASDVLEVLLHYDGIHDKKGDRPSGPAQLAEFVANGDLMLLDWFGHVEMKEVREEAAKESNPPALRDFHRCFAESVKCTAIGRYRDPSGRIGAVQRVEVRKVSELVKRANAALNEAILRGDIESDWLRTAARMVPGAMERRQWIFLDGHSVGITFPAHPAEWARNKREFVEEGFRDYARKVEGKDEPPPPVLEDPKEPAPAADRRNEKAEADFIVQFLSMSPVALVEGSESVTIRIGDPARPSTLRFRLHDLDERNMDEAVAKAVPVLLDDALADRLLGGPAPEDPGVRAVLEWGPPEENVRALLARAAATDGEKRKAALDRLAAFAESWNRDVGIPEAPAPAGDFAAVQAAWRRWYDAVLAGPR